MRNLLLLLIAIILEIVGDASVRIGLRNGKPIFSIVGAALLVCYGITISFPNWTFSRTMGVYIALFFVVAQGVAMVMMKETIAVPTLLGGALIVTGGLVILLWRPV